MKRILIVSGDYGLIRQSRQALSVSGFSYQTAYSHNDGIYSLENGDFDAVLVDAAMIRRQSTDSTVMALARLRSTMPVIALSPDGTFGRGLTLPGNVKVSQPTEMAILQTVSSALKLPMTLPQQQPDQPRVHKQTADMSHLIVAADVAEEIQTLFELSQSLTQVLAVSEVLNRVVEAARRLTNAEEGMILLPDEDGGQLYLRAKVGIDNEVARNFRVKTEDTIAGQVYSSAQPVLIGASGPQKIKTEYLVNALLYVPIVYEAHCIGVLGVNNKKSEAVFLPKHQDLLQNLASFAAIALENARSHEETLKRTRELQALVEASQALNSSLSLSTTLPNICHQMMQVLDVNFAAVYEWNRESKQLQLLSRSSRLFWAVGHGPKLNLSRRPMLQKALDEKADLRVSQRDSSPEQSYLEHIGADTVQYIPLWVEDRALGIVQFFYAQPPESTPDHEALQRIRSNLMEALALISSQTNSVHPQALVRAMEKANEQLKANWSEAAMFSIDQSALVVQLEVGQAAWSSPNNPVIDLNRFPDLLQAVENQATVNRQADTRSLTSGLIALLDITRCRSAAALPLIQGGTPRGMVVVADARRSRLIDQRDLDMGRAVAAQAATALENARLIHHLEKSLADLKEAQERLVQTARLTAMGELAAAVAHQINNPLTTIIGDADLLLSDEAPTSPNYKSLQAIHRAGKRASGVARRLLAISRPDSAESPPERIDVVDTIQGVISLVKGHIERDGIEIVADLPTEPLPAVWAVQGQLDDIWLNLLLNAHDALMGQNNGVRKIGVQASAVHEQDQLEIVIWDNGPGIPAKIVNEVFKPFFTTKPPGEGTGLGLHICRQTAERVGGSIRVQSEEGNGARFTITLPTKRGGNES